MAVVFALCCKRFGSPLWLPQELIDHMPGLAGRSRMAGVLIIAAGVLHVTGLIDDRKHLGPWIKLIIQFAVALFLTTVGQIRFSLFIPNPFITTLLSVFWIVVIVNAFNFLDNMDGLSAGIALICSTIFLFVAMNSGQVFVSGLAVLLIGALLGFLLFNFPPAKIFMGDAGSLVVGLILAVISIQATYFVLPKDLLNYLSDESISWYERFYYMIKYLIFESESKVEHGFSIFAPLIILAIPLYDFISVISLRLLQGVSPFKGDKQHFSHRLVSRGMSTRQAVLTIYLATACTGLGATFLHQVSTTGAIVIFGQTLLIVFIIAILEQPLKYHDSEPKNNHNQ